MPLLRLQEQNHAELARAFGSRVSRGSRGGYNDRETQTGLLAVHRCHGSVGSTAAVLWAPKEALDTAVSLGLANERWRRLHAQKTNLFLEIVAHVDAAVIVSQPQAGGDAA